MQIRILGCSGGIGPGLRTTSLLVDGRLLIDAGTGVGDLHAAELAAITERAMRGELDFAGALTQRVAMLKGLNLSALEACHAKRVRLNPGAEILVKTMAANGARAVRAAASSFKRASAPCHPSGLRR